MRIAGPSRAGRAAGALLACLLLACGTAVAGCGGDDEEGGTTSSTTETIEPATPTGPTGAAGDEGQEQAPPSDDTSLDPDGGTVTPPAESESQTEDSAENDVAPEPGSAEESFEQHCEQNPEACG